MGCSNFSAEQLEEAAAAAHDLGVTGFVNVQNHYSLLERTPEADVIPEIERLGMSLVPYFPLASGMLTGKYKRGEDAPEGTRLAAWGDRAGAFLSDDRFDVVERLDAYARDHGHTLPELALSWVAGAPTVASVIAGATSPEQVRANAAATEAWTLTAGSARRSTRSPPVSRCPRADARDGRRRRGHRAHAGPAGRPRG